MAIHLFVQYYVPRDVTRQRETDTCLRRNIDNPLVDVIHVFLEKEEDRPRIPTDRKVKVSLLPRRITYADWLENTNTLTPGDISICLNADMYLDGSVELLRKHAKMLAERRHFLALSRYNHDGKRFVLNSNPHWTQDTWVVVRGDQPFPSALLQETRFELGHPGCDNKIAYVMHSYGFTVSNPCLQIRTIHLHSDEGRPYDSRKDKLIGLHAFVHPAPKLGESSKLDVELLSRAPVDLTEMVVNQWINERKQYKLAGKSPNAAHVHELPAAVDAEVLGRAHFTGEAPELLSAIDPDKPTGKVVAKAALQTPTATGSEVTTPALPFVQVRRSEVNFKSLRLLARFGHRFEVFESDHELLFADAGWPAVAKLRKDELDGEFHELPPAEQFALGFAAPVLDLFPSVVTAFARNKRDLLFWQYPCRTEQDAWDKTVAQPAYRNKTDERNIYVGLPWATFIDKEKDPDILLLLIASRLREVRDVLTGYGITLRVHTVCQHIFWPKQMPSFKRLGITDLWISHKQKSHDAEEGVRLHAWSLYAVNYRDPQRQTGLEIKPIFERRMLASFKGAHMKHYISKVRLDLKKLAGRPRMDVEITDEWHFNKIVYEVQVAGNHVHDKTIDQQSVVKYNRKLSNTVFSLCPVGAGPNTLRLWESLAVGAIPVVLSDTHELPDPQLFAPGCGLKWDDAIVFHPEAEVAKLEMRLRAIPLEELQNMQRAGRLLYQLIEEFSPVGLTRSRADWPVALIDVFKPQQLQIDDATAPVVDGKARWDFANIDLASGKSGFLHFDKTELLMGVAVAFDIPPDAGPLTLYLLRAQTPPRKPVPLGTVHSSRGHFQTLWFDSIDHAPWAYSLRWKLEGGTDAASDGSAPRILLTPIVARDRYAIEVAALDAAGVLKAASDDNPRRKDDLFDTEHINTAEVLQRLRQFAVTHKCKKGDRLFAPAKPRKSNLAGELVRDGVTMFVHLMNRNENVAQNLPNWLKQKFDEIILLDWSSEPPVTLIAGVLDDPRVRIVRVEGQKSFIRVWAQNVATRMARYNRVFKCDSDVVFTGDFFGSHPLQKGEFWVGDWMQGRDFNERHLHGDTYYHIDDFDLVHGYDERIGSYGHDDTNLKDRMVLAGLRKRVFSYNQMYHQPHDNSKRTSNQKMVHPMVNTRYHRIVTNEDVLWNPALKLLAEVKVLAADERIVTLRMKHVFPKREEPKALEKAIELVASWYAPPKQLKSLSTEKKIQLIWDKSVE